MLNAFTAAPDPPMTAATTFSDPALFKTQAFIDGHWTDGAHGRFAVHDPADGALLAEVANCGGTDAQRAIDAAAVMARAMPEDPRSFGLLVRIADEARRGRSDALAGAPPEARAALAAQAAALLEAGGEGAAAAGLRAAAPAP